MLCPLQRIWDLLDLWHYKMNELDSEVQDKAEQDPDQAQELLDCLMMPLQQYQHVSQLAERRTAGLNMVRDEWSLQNELARPLCVRRFKEHGWVYMSQHTMVCINCGLLLKPQIAQQKTKQSCLLVYFSPSPFISAGFGVKLVSESNGIISP